MNFLSEVFDNISTLHALLAEKTNDVERAANLLVKTCREMSGGENPAADALIRSRQRWYERHLDEMRRIQKDYDFSCNLARRLIAKVEDDTIAMGLRLYGINRMKWHEIAECLGVPNIQERCENYLTTQEGNYL